MTPVRSLFASLLVLALVPAADAAPVDARPGQMRVTYDKKGTPLRSAAAKTAAPVATLASGTQVVVEEVQLPWLRVRPAHGGTGGWLMAWQAVDPAALSPNPAPAPIRGRVGGVSQSDSTLAGRQFDADTEARFRAGRRDLQGAYGLVDRMEAETRALDPADSIAFIMDGSIGRRGRTYDRVALLPPSKNPSGGRGRAKKAGRIAGKIGRQLGGLIGRGKGGGAVEKAGQAVAGLSAFIDKVNELNRHFTPEQEYYLGRAVAAETLARYGVDPDEDRRRYVKLLGDAIVRVTTKLPSTFGGYHFEVLDSDKVNGVSGPGGYVLITRGAVMACTTEDELAAVLCHELAHVWRKHGEAVLRQSKQWSGQINAVMAGLQGGGMDANQFGQQWLGLFTTGVGVASKTAVDEGYGQALEFQADADGAELLWEAYFAPTAMRDVLTGLEAHGSHGHAGTHAPPHVRAQALGPTLARLTQYLPSEEILAERKARFERERGGPIAIKMR